MNSLRWNGARCHGDLRSLYFKSGIKYLHFGCMQLNLTFSNQYLNSKREQTWQTCPSVIGIKISPSLTCNRTKLRALETPGPLVGVGGALAAPWAGNTKQGRQKGENISNCRRFKKMPIVEKLEYTNRKIGKKEKKQATETTPGDTSAEGICSQGLLSWALGIGFRVANV